MNKNGSSISCSRNSLGKQNGFEPAVAQINGRQYPHFHQDSANQPESDEIQYH